MKVNFFSTLKPEFFTYGIFSYSHSPLFENFAIFNRRIYHQQAQKMRKSKIGPT